MAYNIVSFDGNIAIAANTFDTTSTPLTLVGKDESGWGQPYNNNFVGLLENFAGASAPSSPRTGTIWFNTGANALEVYFDGAFQILNATAGKLTTARNIAISGAATGSAPFDGSADITIPITLQTTAVTPGNYVSANITIDQYGRVTSAGNGYVANPNQTEVNSWNGRTGAVNLSALDVDAALGFTPVNPSALAPFATSASVASSLAGYQPALGYTPVNRAGDYMLGGLNMNNNALTNLPNGINLQDAVNVGQLNYVSVARTQRVFNGGGETQYNVTVSPNAPSGGNDGDVWYKY